MANLKVADYLISQLYEMWLKENNIAIFRKERHSLLASHNFK